MGGRKGVRGFCLGLCVFLTTRKGVNTTLKKKRRKKGGQRILPKEVTEDSALDSESRLTTRKGSSDVCSVNPFFTSQSLHNGIFLKKNPAILNDEVKFPFFLLHKRAKPFTPPLPSPATHLSAHPSLPSLSAHTSHTTHRARTQTTLTEGF